MSQIVQSVKLDINVQEPYFSLIAQGKKTIEGRLAKTKFLDLRIDDLVRINNSLLTQVKSVRQYPTFKQMLIMEGLFYVLPEINDIDQAEKVYYNFYTPSDESEYGVVAIGLKLLEEDNSNVSSK